MRALWAWCTCLCTASSNSLSITRKCSKTPLLQLCWPMCDFFILASRLIALDKCPGVRLTNWHRWDCKTHHCQSTYCDQKRRHTRCSWLHPALCWTDCGDVKLPSTQYGPAFWMTKLKLPYSLTHQMPSTRLTRSRPCITSDICALLFLINSYRSHTELFVDGDVIHSQEGTTQGDPMAMPMYAIATVPFIKKLTSGAKQTWYMQTTLLQRGRSPIYANGGTIDWGEGDWQREYLEIPSVFRPGFNRGLLPTWKLKHE